MDSPLCIAWITFFPVEWLTEAPEEIRSLPKGHSASWQRVLLREFQKDPTLKLHIFVIRKQFKRDVVFESGNATFYCLKAPGSLRAPSLFWVDTWLLRPYMKRIKPDVVHAWGMEQAAGLVASRLGRPYVLTMQGILSWLKNSVTLNRYERLMSFIEGRVLPKATKVTVEARFAVDFLRTKWPGTDVEQIEHAPDPLFAKITRKNDPSRLRVLSMGGMNELKGGDLLLRCLANLEPKIPFDMVAIGNHETPLLTRLRNELPASLFERIRFTGQLTPEQVADEMASATMLLYPTRGDTSPNSVKEAVVHGLPVVSARVGGISEYVVDGENGVLFEPDSLHAISSGFYRALDHPLFSKGLVNPAQLIKAREQLSAATMAARFKSLYKKSSL